MAAYDNYKYILYVCTCVHTTRMRKRIFALIPELRSLSLSRRSTVGMNDTTIFDYVLAHLTVRIIAVLHTALVSLLMWLLMAMTATEVSISNRELKAAQTAFEELTATMVVVAAAAAAAASDSASSFSIDARAVRSLGSSGDTNSSSSGDSPIIVHNPHGRPDNSYSSGDSASGSAVDAIVANLRASGPLRPCTQDDVRRLREFTRANCALVPISLAIHAGSAFLFAFVFTGGFIYIRMLTHALDPNSVNSAAWRSAINSQLFPAW